MTCLLTGSGFQGLLSRHANPLVTIISGIGGAALLVWNERDSREKVTANVADLETRLTANNIDLERKLAI